MKLLCCPVPDEWNQHDNPDEECGGSRFGNGGDGSGKGNIVDPESSRALRGSTSVNANLKMVRDETRFREIYGVMVKAPDAGRDKRLDRIFEVICA